MRLTAGKPFAVVGVNRDDDLDAIRKIVADKQINWRNFWDGTDSKNSIANAWCITSIPISYLLDANGVIRYLDLKGEPLDAAIEELMSELGKPVNLVGFDHEAEDAKTLARE